MRCREAIAAIAVATLVSGCGGEDLELDPGAKTPTVATTATGIQPVEGITDAADQICDRVAKRFAEAQRETPRSFEQAAQITEALVGIAKEGEDALGELSPPPLQAPAFNRYLETRARAVRFLEAAQTAARDEDGEAYEKARTALNDGVAQRAELARQAGLDGCADFEGG